jgi:uncharacterized protein (TIGR02118 family)
LEENIVAKLIALFEQPENPAAFDKAYFETHLPLISKVPGLLHTSLTRFTRTLMGEGYYLMAEMTFESLETLKAGIKSPEMAQAGENLNSFASGLVTLMFGVEENP